MSLNEVIVPTANQRLSQGDIIKFLQPKDPEEEFGVIVTGDCDIENGKVTKQLSFCYMMSLGIFFDRFYITPLVQAGLNELKEKLRSGIKKNLKGLNENQKGISEEGLEYLLKNTSKESFELKFPGIGSKIVNNFTICKKHSGKQNFDVCDYYEVSVANEKKIDEKKLGDNFCNKVINLPGDKFYLSYIPHEENLGFILNLRRISEICVESIAIKPEMENNCNAKRIGQVTSPYREKIGEKIGSMFSDIALPCAYEIERKQVSGFIFDSKWRNK